MTTNTTQQEIEAFAGQMMGEMGSAVSAALGLLGDRLGLYRGLRKGGPSTPDELARRTETNERYVREWLCAQAAAGWINYDATSGRFSMNAAQAAVLGDEDSPASMLGMIELVTSAFLDAEKVEKAFRTGEGVGWHEHHDCLFRGTERFFRPGYAANLVSEWIPALEGVEEKLASGGRVADVGCGHGASTILMAQAYPESTFVGYDYHAASIERARAAAEKAGVSERVSFEIGTAKDFPGKDFDLVCFFDCLHDMGDPIGAASHVRQSLSDQGTWMVVEPFAHDSVEENLNPVGRIFYSFSTMICTPASRSQEVGLALGAQAGEFRLREVVHAGGFSQFRRATETPFNLILEAKA